MHEPFVLLDEGSKKPRSRIFISKKVIVLCQARKCRDADHLQNFVYDREMIDARELAQTIEDARRNPEPVPLPDYALDVHTQKGGKAGKTRNRLFQDEFKAPGPRVKGEFLLGRRPGQGGRRGEERPQRPLSTSYLPKRCLFGQIPAAPCISCSLAWKGELNSRVLYQEEHP
jgi:hypothetical protein